MKLPRSTLACGASLILIADDSWLMSYTSRLTVDMSELSRSSLASGDKARASGDRSQATSEFSSANKEFQQREVQASLELGIHVVIPPQGRVTCSLPYSCHADVIRHVMLEPATGRFA